MWTKLAAKLASRLAATEDGRNILKGVLVIVLCFFMFMLVPMVFFAPIAGFVTGISDFFSGEEGEDFDDTSDLDTLLNGEFDITATQYYGQIMKARAKHMEKIKAEQELLAQDTKENNKYTRNYEYTDQNDELQIGEETVYPEVTQVEPEPPVVAVAAYFCITEEVQIADSTKKISSEAVEELYDKICKRPFQVEKINEDSFVISTEYMTDEEIIAMLQAEDVLQDEADLDFFRVSMERLEELMGVSGTWGYAGIPSGNISDITVAKQIWDYFKGIGWSDYAISALIGNFEAECSLRPNVEETNGTGIGLGQWSLERRERFLSWLSSNSRSITDILSQCEYILVENIWYGGTVTLYNGGGLKHKSKAASLSEFGTYPYTQLSDAVDDFMWHWESPNYEMAQQDRRHGAALDAYNLFAGGGNPIYSGSYTQIKKSFFPGGVLPESEKEAASSCVSISFKNSKGATKHVKIHKSIADETLKALTEISSGGYEIIQISGFVWKKKTNSSSGSLSSHSYGLAIDINWNYGNPQVKNGQVLVGTAYGSHALTMHEGDVAVDTMKDYGWTWGGNWKSSKDYMHFSIPGD